MLGPNPVWEGSTTKFTKIGIFFKKESHCDSAKRTRKELWMLSWDFSVRDVSVLGIVITPDFRVDWGVLPWLVASLVD